MGKASAQPVRVLLGISARETLPSLMLCVKKRLSPGASPIRSTISGHTSRFPSIHSPYDDYDSISYFRIEEVDPVALR